MARLDKYIIRRSEDRDIHPEETLADSLSEHTIIEMPIGHEVFRTLYIFIFLISIFVLLKSFQLQFVKGNRFAVIAQRNSSQYSMPALRGIIYDRNNKSLVENVPIFDLIAIHNDLPAKSGIGSLTDSLSPIIKMDQLELADIFNKNTNSATFLIKKGLSKEEVTKIKVLSLKGIYVVANSQRHYFESNAFSSVIGYTAKVNEAEMDADPYYLPTDRVGRLGIEAYYEKQLRGEHRNLIIKNSVLSGKENVKPGNDLILNIDQNIQDNLYQTMTSVLDLAGLKRAAAIVQNPKTGEILGLVSLPAFDANIFENYFNPASADKISKILEDKNNALFNRVIAGRYSPGSTIKPLLALAGLRENVVTPNTTIYANGSISVTSKYDPSVVYTFRDWRVHGLTDLKKAIADSVDVYFYALGGGYGNIRGLGIDKIVGYLKSFLADNVLGIDLPGEVSGLVPSPDWKQKTKGEEWFIGDTYNISIGQGDLNVTPLWLNTYIGSIANNGNLMKPYVVKEIKDQDGKVITQNQPQVLGKIPFNDQTIRTIKEGMRQTILSGTATSLQNLPVPVAAKTGTAQVSNRGLNSLFVVFGPYEDPNIAMTILIEGVESQGLAIKIAHDFLLWYFGQHNYPQPQ